MTILQAKLASTITAAKHKMGQWAIHRNIAVRKHFESISQTPPRGKPRANSCNQTGFRAQLLSLLVVNVHSGFLQRNGSSHVHSIQGTKTTASVVWKKPYSLSCTQSQKVKENSVALLGSAGVDHPGWCIQESVWHYYWSNLWKSWYFLNNASTLYIVQCII